MLKSKFNPKNDSVGDFLLRARNNQTQLGQPMFGQILPPPGEVTPYLDQMAALQEQIQMGNKGLIPRRDDLRKTITGMISRQCLGVNALAGGDRAILEASGFEVCKTPEPWPLPGRIASVLVTNGHNSGEVDIKYSTAKHRRSYIVQMMLPGGEWRTVEITTKRHVTVYNVPVKEFAYFRVAGVNATGQGEWSVPVRLVVGR